MNPASHDLGSTTLLKIELYWHDNEFDFGQNEGKKMC
jgi:hypothetical protein